MTDLCRNGVTAVALLFVCSAAPASAADPWLWLDEPADNTTINGPLRVSGWAFDWAATTDSGVDAVHVWAYPHPGSGEPPFFVGAATTTNSRADVGAAFGTQFTNSGFSLQAAGLAPGPYLLAVFAHSTLTNSFGAPRTVIVTIGDPVRIWIDFPADGAAVRSRFVMMGWALDSSATADAGVDAVHAWAYPAAGGPPIFLGYARYDQPRYDVALAFGPQYINSGWRLETTPSLPVGTYDVVCFPHRTATGTFSPPARLRVRVTARGY